MWNIFDSYVYRAYWCGTSCVFESWMISLWQSVRSEVTRSKTMNISKTLDTFVQLLSRNLYSHQLRMGVTCYHISTSFGYRTCKLFPLLSIPLNLDVLSIFSLKVISAEKYSLIFCGSSEYLVKSVVLYTSRPFSVTIILFWNQIHRWDQFTLYSCIVCMYSHTYTLCK